MPFPFMKSPEKQWIWIKPGSENFVQDDGLVVIKASPSWRSWCKKGSRSGRNGKRNGRIPCALIFRPFRAWKNNNPTLDIAKNKIGIKPFPV